MHSLPYGYDTVIDEEGSNISAGEKQLLTIARAFLADPALLILDEATSSVDTRTEVLVQHAMAALRSDRTSFVIAHRLSTIRDADVILVMENGAIVEQGTTTTCSRLAARTGRSTTPSSPGPSRARRSATGWEPRPRWQASRRHRQSSTIPSAASRVTSSCPASRPRVSTVRSPCTLTWSGCVHVVLHPDEAVAAAEVRRDHVTGSPDAGGAGAAGVRERDLVAGRVPPTDPVELRLP